MLIDKSAGVAVPVAAQGSATCFQRVSVRRLGLTLLHTRIKIVCEECSVYVSALLARSLLSEVVKIFSRFWLERIRNLSAEVKQMSRSPFFNIPSIP